MFLTKIHSNSINVRAVSFSIYGVRRSITISKEESRDIGDNCKTKQGNWPRYPSKL